MDKLYKIAEEENIYIYEKNFRGTTKGLYSNNVVALKRSMTSAETKCILGEELGHHFKTVGDITDQTKVENRKQERQARGMGYALVLSLDDLVQALMFPCVTIDEILDFLNITFQYFTDCINYYIEKYGLYYSCEHYTLHFNPLYVTASYFNYENIYI